MTPWQLFWSGWVLTTILASWITVVVCVVGGVLDLRALIHDLKNMPEDLDSED